MVPYFKVSLGQFPRSVLRQGTCRPYHQYTILKQQTQRTTIERRQDMFQITTTDEGRALVKTPYNSEYVSLIKKIGGARWNASAKAWDIPESEIDTAREYMLEIYGETDIPDDTMRFPIRITFKEDYEVLRDSVFLFGKTIARARGRDSGAMLGEDVLLEEGTPTSGGSAQYWKTIIPKGCVVKVRNVTQAAYEAEQADDRWTAVIVNETAIDREALLQEKKKHLARIAEIDAILNRNDWDKEDKSKPRKKDKKASKK